MKKKIILLLLTFLLIPKFTFAEELPREGVHYFMDFPNNEEVVTKNYDETGERLIYSGKTNENGEVVLEDWNEEGELRIVQVVPNGYKTEHKELIVDLKNKKASFVDYREANLINPSTGQSILLILITIIVIASLIHTIITKDKKVLIPLLLLLIIPSLKVFANDNGFIISVQDKKGNPLKDVEIEVYAKPKNIEASPAIEIYANGGKFLNGEEVAYIKIDETGKPLVNNTIADEISLYNIMFASKDGYSLDVENFVTFVAGSEDTLTNDTVIHLNWIENQEAKKTKFYGNGGKFRIDGKNLDYIEFDNNIIDLLNIDLSRLIILSNSFLINKPNNYLVGFDIDSKCLNYDSKGYPITIPETPSDDTPPPEVADNQQLYSDENYLCWNQKPDGLYINGKLFGLGNVFNCYSNNSLNSFKNNILIIDGIEEELKLNLNEKTVSFCVYGRGCIEIDSLEIVDNGETVVELTQGDLEKEIDKSSFIYRIINYEEITNYFSTINTTCGKPNSQS